MYELDRHSNGCMQMNGLIGGWIIIFFRAKHVAVSLNKQKHFQCFLLKMTK